MSWRASISRNLQSIKIMADPILPSSGAVRSFWATRYQEIKHLNPGFPFMLRANGGGDPYILFEYDFAKKVKVDVSGMTPDQIESKMKEMVQKGDGMPRALHQSIEPFKLPSVVE